MNIFRKIIVAIILTFSISLVMANERKEYAKIAKERASKIVSELKIDDPRIQLNINNLISNHYIKLNNLHSKRDLKIKKNPSNKDFVKDITKDTDEIAIKENEKFVQKLNNLLNQNQVEFIKDGMTYHTVPKTYTNYLLMLPVVSETDSKIILNYLKDGRDLAMIGGSAKNKHAAFNNAKGKIANHLAAKGYDLKKEGNDWADRRNTKDSTLAIKESNRITDILNLQDIAKKESVRNLVAYQYQKIEEFTEIKKNKFDENKKVENKEERGKADEAVWQEYKLGLDTQRDVFFKKLLEFINKDQIEIVKNEMTANGLINEYARFQELLPNLKEEHEKMVYQFLLEARENALNVLTNRERNQWFIKYRGRANNYLSKQGYNLRKATEELEQKQAENN